MKRAIVCTLGFCLVFAMACYAVAHPLPGEVLKFSQLPMIETTIDGVTYYGHDESSTVVNSLEYPMYYNGTYIADDFVDKYDRSVVHVRWWGSYMNPDVSGGALVDQFAIIFQSNVPANGSFNFDHPDYGNALLNSQICTRDMDGLLMPQEGTFTETLVDGSNPNEPVYEYNAELLCPFEQEADTVYWLTIFAMVDFDPQANPELVPLEWGWHNRDYTVKDPYASTYPDVDPGERIVGYLDTGIPNDPTDDTAIWHCQSDAVSGDVANVAINSPCNVHIDQQTLFEEHYVDLYDGPDGISAYSKDLAFQLYTVPEPSTITLLVLGALMFLIRRFRK